MLYFLKLFPLNYFWQRLDLRSASDLLRAIYDLFQPLAGSRKKMNKVENKEEKTLNPQWYFDGMEHPDSQEECMV